MHVRSDMLSLVAQPDSKGQQTGCTGLHHGQQHATWCRNHNHTGCRLHNMNSGRSEVPGADFGGSTATPQATPLSTRVSELLRLRFLDLPG